jgi:hypothetical protein
MALRQLIGIVLVVIGLVSLIWGGISWTEQTTVVDIGPFEAQTEERETLPLPPILGGVALAGGVLLLVTSRVASR